MKKLSKQDIIDILYGCTVLGTGGGGSLEKGLAMLQYHMAVALHPRQKQVYLN